jgi:hypothetical protein
VTSKTEGKVDNSHMLVKYDARLRDNVAVNVVQEVTDTVQVRSTSHSDAGVLTWRVFGGGLHVVVGVEPATRNGVRSSSSQLRQYARHVCARVSFCW